MESASTLGIFRRCRGSCRYTTDCKADAPIQRWSKTSMSAALRQVARCTRRLSRPRILCIRNQALSISSFPSRYYHSSPARHYAAFAETIPSRPTMTKATPNLDYLEKEEIEVELPPPEQISVIITDRAAEVRTTLIVTNQWIVVLTFC